MRIAFAAALTPATILVVAYLLTLTDLTAILLVLAVPVDWTAAVILLRASRHSHSVALRERATASAILATAATAIGLVAFNRFVPFLDRSETGFLLVLAIAALSVPATFWLLLWLLRRF